MNQYIPLFGFIMWIANNGHPLLKPVSAADGGFCSTEYPLELL